MRFFLSGTLWAIRWGLFGTFTGPLVGYLIFFLQGGPFVVCHGITAILGAVVGAVIGFIAGVVNEIFRPYQITIATQSDTGRPTVIMPRKLLVKPLASTIPTREQINVYNSLDEQVACEHFLGKSLEEAEGLFRDNDIVCLEDLMHMGPAAFQYYVKAAIAYIRNQQADAASISSFAGVLELKIEFDKDDLAFVAQELTDACHFILEHWSSFDIDSSIYGNLQNRYCAISAGLCRLSETKT